MSEQQYLSATDRPGLMNGAPPFGPHGQVTLANWQEPPFNRWAFQHVRELIPTARIDGGGNGTKDLQRNERSLDDLEVLLSGRRMTVAEVLASTYTDGFLVLHRGEIVAEQYFNGLTASTPHLLMSVSKSVTGAVAGVLAARGDLDVTAPVTSVLPELDGTSFTGATVRDLLDMRAGTKFGESYSDPDSDARRCEEVYLWRPVDGSLKCDDALSYFATLPNDGPHGGAFRYRSILTDVLGWVLERVAGERLAQLISREIWRPMGAEFDADITVDGHGNACADGGMSATLRDLARFGELFLEPERIGLADWVADTLRGAPDGAVAFTAGDNPRGYPAGAHYRNCWWVREPSVPFFYANGINGQHVFVHGPSATVIVKLSTWPVAGSVRLFNQTLAAAKAIAEGLD